MKEAIDTAQKVISFAGKFLASLFQNASTKLKIFAKVLFVLSCLVSFVWGITIWDDYHNRWVISVLIWIIGPLFAYIQSLILYVFAQIGEDISKATK